MNERKLLFFWEFGDGWRPPRQQPNIILTPPPLFDKSLCTSVFFYLQVWVSRVSLIKLEAEKVELATKASDQTILVIKHDVEDDAVDGGNGDD